METETTLPENPRDEFGHVIAQESLSVARVQYLQLAYDAIKRDLIPQAPPREQVALAFSFPIKGARGSRMRIGECHYLDGQDQHKFVAIHPILWSKSDVEVLATLAHEMAHTTFEKGVGHRKPFANLVASIGLEGKATATVPGPGFVRWADTARTMLPPFPGGPKFDFSGGKKQTARLRKFQCSCDEPVIVRAARDELLATCDQCGTRFERAE